MEQIKFTIPGNPLVQKRHKDRILKRPDGTPYTMHYDPSLNDKNAWKAAVRLYAPKIPFRNCALRVDWCWVFPRPSSHYGTGKNANVLKPSAPRHHFVRPDRDNLDKIVLDAMKGVFWGDDAQISDGYLKKIWGRSPATHCIITVLT